MTQFNEEVSLQESVMYKIVVVGSVFAMTMQQDFHF